MLGTPRVIADQDAREVSASQNLPLGSKAVTPDGRVFRYARIGAANVVAGNLLVNADLVANHTNRTCVAAAVGATKVSVNIGATAATANQYKDGYLVINDATGEGIAYKILGHPAHAGSGALVVTLVDPVMVALTSSSEATLKQNPWGDVVISAADQADMAVGVPNVNIPATYYGWLQTGGECSVLADEAVTKGKAITIGDSTAGAVSTLNAAGEVQIGIASEALVDTENRAVFLTIDS